MSQHLPELEDDFEDLDQLLNESLAVAEAKRSQKLGRRLNADQQLALEANAAAERFATWKTVACIAHVELTVCKCGAGFELFSSWYRLEMSKREQGKQQLTALAEPLSGFPTSQYRTMREVPTCSECIPDLPVTDESEFPILESLGDSAEWDTPAEDNLETLEGDAA